MKIKLKISFLFLSCLSTFVWSSEYFDSKESHDAIRSTASRQVYGVPTYDALFKYILDDTRIRPSFFHAVIPDLEITESTRIDEHMNPLQEFQELRHLLNDSATSKMIKKINGQPLDVRIQDNPHPHATEFLTKIMTYYDDIKRAFPQPQYEGTMDFVCKMPNDEYILVEMQVIPYDNWDKRALAYVAAFYGRQMKKGDQWKDIKKVIGINILGGGKDRLRHWADTADQYMRHYKLQEQLHQPYRYIDGIEIIQYSLMNVPAEMTNIEFRDWMTFFRDASHMTEEDVEQKIHTPDVKEAFERAKLSLLPDEVLERYLFEDGQYSHYSEHTQKQVSEAEQKGKMEGLVEGEQIGLEKGEQKAKREIALNLLKLNVADDTIIQASGLNQTELDALKSGI